jgi:FMN-dependent NADH-azoreductase
MFGFVRIADQTIVRAEGTNLAPEAVQLAMTSAQKQIDQRFATSKAA